MTLHNTSYANNPQDFRSKDGLYHLLPSQFHSPSTDAPRSDSHSEASHGHTSHRPTSHITSASSTIPRRGQDLFQSSVLQHPDSAVQFYRFIATLRQRIQNTTATSAVHQFIKTLRDQGRLLRCYTQNFDGLEAREGLRTELSNNPMRLKVSDLAGPQKATSHSLSTTSTEDTCDVVMLHGDLSTLRCQICSARSPWTDQATQAFFHGLPPECEACQRSSQRRRAQKKRVSAVGALRPNIVLYGEIHWESDQLDAHISSDLHSGPDLLLIMGTSLKVSGVRHLVQEFAKTVHRHQSGRVIFVNRTPPASSVWDGYIDDFIMMDCDEWVSDLQRREGHLASQQSESSIAMSSVCDVDHPRIQGQELERVARLPSSHRGPKRRMLSYKAKNAEERRIESWLEAYFAPMAVHH
jgi:NAD-dependent SIR2 family protein deacetylase